MKIIKYMAESGNEIEAFITDDNNLYIHIDGYHVEASVELHKDDAIGLIKELQDLVKEMNE